MDAQLFHAYAQSATKTKTDQLLARRYVLLLRSVKDGWPQLDRIEFDAINTELTRRGKKS